MLESYLTIATHPLLWMFIGLTVVFFGVQGLVGRSAEAPTAPDDRLRRLAETVGLTGLHPVLFLILLLTWGIVAGTLFVGLYAILWQVIFHAPPEGAEDVWNWRFTLAQLVALTTVLGAVIALPITINRLILTRRQTNTIEQGHITDRINKAVEGLGAEKTVRLHRKDSNGNFLFHEKEGSQADTKPKLDFKRPVIVELTEPNLEVRIGAIYALERISQDSARDHIQIMEILCAYVRQNAKVTGLTPREPPFENPGISIDIQAAIDVIGRRSERQKAIELDKKHRLDLRETDLSFANFAKGDFAAAILANCKLEGCNFRDADLSGAILQSSVLNFSEFFRCNLTGAKLDGVVINRPTPITGGFTASINMGETKGISFPSADLSALQHLGPKEKMNEMMGSGDTFLSGRLKHTMPPVEVMEKNIYRGMEELEEQEAEDLLKIEHAGFKYWFPFDAKRDMAFGPARRKFLVELGLDHWPYIED